MNTITIRGAFSETDVETFWSQLRAYQDRDLFPDPQNEDRAYFLSDAEYRAEIEALHARPHDRIRYLFFHRDGWDISLALCVIYDSKDGKCFILEFCVYPQFRGNGTGSACAQRLLDWSRANGGRYAEINCGDLRRGRFWRRVGRTADAPAARRISPLPGGARHRRPWTASPPAQQLPFGNRRAAADR